MKLANDSRPSSEFDHTIRVRIVERLEQDSIDYSEDRGVGPDTQGKRDNGGNGKAGPFNGTFPHACFTSLLRLPTLRLRKARLQRNTLLTGCGLPNFSCRKVSHYVRIGGFWRRGDQLFRDRLIETETWEAKTWHKEAWATVQWKKAGDELLGP